MSRRKVDTRPYSKLVFDGVKQTPSRAMLRAVGYDDAISRSRRSASPRPGARSRPATCTSTSWPKRPRRAPNAAGGKSMMFNTITVSDGISMGTPGMRYSLVSREVIADSIETVVGARRLRRLRRDRRLRQEHAGLRDGDGAARSARGVRLRRHDPAGREEARHRFGLRGRRRARGGRDQRQAAQGSRAHGHSRRRAAAAACTRPTPWRRRSRRSA